MKNQYLTEAGLQESIPQKAAVAIDKILDKVDPPGITPEDLGKAIAIIVKNGYQTELQKRFMDVLHTELGINESLNEAKDEYYPDSPEALRQATQTAKEILDKHKASIKAIADKYEGQANKSREMMDELNALIDVDLEGVPFEDYVSNKVKATLGKALFRYFAQKNPELAKMMNR
jgi:hypothetical protein